MSANFKTCLFGGFDRQDVVSYIEKLSRENRQQVELMEKEKGELEAKVAELTAKADELVALRAQVEELQAQAQLASQLQEELDASQEQFYDLSEECTLLRREVADYQAMKDHIAEIEISAHRRTEEFRANAISQLREMVTSYYQWCEQAKGQYRKVSDQFVQKLKLAQETVGSLDTGDIDALQEKLVEFSRSFEEEKKTPSAVVETEEE